MNLYIYTYNNYYSRIFKQAGNDITDYNEYLHYGPVQGVYGFTPGDGINTVQIIGTSIANYDGLGDYLIAHNPVTQTIDSRWFIIDSKRTRDGQWHLTLHRDLLVDFQDYYLKAPMYIEKATLKDDDPFIFNSENVSVNQIKTKEYYLKDKSNCAWIIGFLSRGFNQEAPYTIKTINTVYNEEMTRSQFDELINAANGYTILTDMYYWTRGTTGSPFASEAVAQLKFSDNLKWSWDAKKQYYIDNIGYFILSGSTVLVDELRVWDDLVKYLNSMTDSEKQEFLNILKMSINDKTANTTKTQFDRYLNYQNRIIKVLESDGVTYKFYKISSNKISKSKKNFTVDTDLSMIHTVPAIPTYLYKIIKAFADSKEDYALYQIPETGKIPGFLTGTPQEIQFEAQEITDIDIEYTIPATRNHLNDAPYDMFCIPYSEEGLKILVEINSYDLHVTTMNSISTLSFTQQLAEKLGSNLLDLQLVPYCPLEGWSTNSAGEFVINANGFEMGQDMTFQYIGTTSTPVIVFFPKYSKGTINSSQINIIDSETNEIINKPLTTENIKLSNECDLYRISSPNWNGQFDFNPAKCGIDTFYQFNIDYTYLPYSPYIHINPNFGNLYGKDFDDARGLICKGDFSISYMSDKWAEYQVQNKNFSNVFERQQENLETTHEINRTKQITQGVISSIGTGVGMGLKTGNIAAGIATGLASAAGSAADIAFNEALHNEALDYQKDMYNYNLDNIQALPDSISKVTAYTNNNKIFPVLEYYTCTDVEKEALANKIAYNGMTVMRIDIMSNFINNTWEYNGINAKGYIKGKLIRPEVEGNHKLNIHGNSFNVLNALSGELDKGVFIE